MTDQSPIRSGLEDWLARVETVNQTLRATAVDRDREGRDPHDEIAVLRAAGLLTIALPKDQGGGGARPSEILKVIRKLAEADTSLAQLMSYHLFGTKIGLGGNNQLLKANRINGFINEGWFHAGIAQAAYPPLLEAKRAGDGFVINGSKPFTSGAAVADSLQVWVRFAEGTIWQDQDISGFLGQFIIANPAKGLSFGGDWDAIGQRQTVSGSARLVDVFARGEDLVNAYPEGTPHPPHVTVHVPIIQLSFADLYIGTAKGALAEARSYIASNARAWVTSGYQRAGDDPLILERFGRLSAKLAAAEALSDLAAQKADAAVARGTTLSEAQRGEVAITAYQAKIAAHEAGLEVTSQIFELMGARAAARSYGFDRFWRNIRTHSLHDPIHYKAHEVGDFEINARYPAPDYYR